MADAQPTINCLWGTPYQDPATGEWRCPSDPTQQNNPVPTPPRFVTGVRTKNPFSGFPQTINYNYNFPLGTVNPTQQLAAAAADDSTKIFGMPPMVALAVGAAALWALSSMGDSGKKQHHE